MNNISWTDNLQNTTKKWLKSIALCGFVPIGAVLGGHAAQAQTVPVAPLSAIQMPVPSTPSGQVEEVSIWICKAASGGCGVFTTGGCVAKAVDPATGFFITQVDIPYPQCGFGFSLPQGLCSANTPYNCAQTKLWRFCNNGAPSSLWSVSFDVKNGCP